MPRSSGSRTAAAIVLTAALAAGAPATGAAQAAPASPAGPSAGADNPNAHGPDPTLALLQASQGPYPVAQAVVVAAEVRRFGGGTIYYPATTQEGRFGGVAVAPGYLAPRSTLAWFAERLASHGFVVINIDTLDRADGPAQRAQQLLAALDHLTASSVARDRVDQFRLAVAGHSMGGGAAVEATTRRPALKAAVPLTPWHTRKAWPDARVPTLIVGAERDTTAEPAQHAELFYESMAAADKAYLELNEADHRTPIHPDPTIGLYAVSWLKRFVDGDLRYEQFLCPPPGAGGAVEEYRDTCPAAAAR
jgi:dienelactone hydrolase